MNSTTAKAQAIYSVSGIGFDDYTLAVKFAHANDATVVQNDNGLIRWEPIPKKAKKTIKHVLVMPDGTKREFRIGRRGLR